MRNLLEHGRLLVGDAYLLPTNFYSSSLLERIMYNRLYEYFMNKNLLPENQFGSQINNSTEHAILQFTRNIAQNFDNGKFTLGVFIDLSKAFDTVYHQILLNKLKHYGVSEKHWLGSKVIFPKENNILKILMTSNIYMKLIVVSHRGLYLDHYFS